MHKIYAQKLAVLLLLASFITWAVPARAVGPDSRDRPRGCRALRSVAPHDARRQD